MFADQYVLDENGNPKPEPNLADTGDRSGYGTDRSCPIRQAGTELGEKPLTHEDYVALIRTVTELLDFIKNS